jgi:hypothetical protein
MLGSDETVVWLTPHAAVMRHMRPNGRAQRFHLLVTFDLFGTRRYFKYANNAFSKYWYVLNGSGKYLPYCISEETLETVVLNNQKLLVLGGRSTIEKASGCSTVLYCTNFH